MLPKKHQIIAKENTAAPTTKSIRHSGDNWPLGILDKS